MLKFLRGRQGYKIKKRENDDHTQDVELIENMPLLCHKTSKRKYNIFNSCQYKIKTLNKDTFSIQNNIQEDIEIPYKEFHDYFWLGFCLTSHSAQGDTYKEPFTIYDWSRRKDDTTFHYVALSRGTSLKHINIGYIQR
jgi:hypothetical protein